MPSNRLDRLLEITDRQSSVAAKIRGGWISLPAAVLAVFTGRRYRGGFESLIGM